MRRRHLPAYVAIYQEAGLRFTEAAAEMVWEDRARELVRIEADETRRRLYFKPLQGIEDGGQVWDQQGRAGHLHSRAAVRWLRLLGDRRKRLPLTFDETKRLCYVEATHP